MILSRGRSESGKTERSSASKNNIPTFEDFLIKRDYVGAKTVLKYSKNYDEIDQKLKKLWLAFCSFHLGDYKDALEQYEHISALDEKNPTLNNNIRLNMGVCIFYLGMHKETQRLIENLPENALKIRLSFHLAHNTGDESRLMELYGSLQDIVEDQLCLAGMHYLTSHYQEAIDIYKRVLLDNKDLAAINVYIALCYYKLDYYDMSQEILDQYLALFPDSTVALNLRACNKFRLDNGKAAELDIRNMSDNGTFGADLIKHNLVVFRNGTGALQVLPQLVDMIPEARLNLAIHYLHRNETREAFELLKNVTPAVPHEYVLKGVVLASLGQELGSKEYIKQAQQCLHLVGSSSSECDTIRGRLSIASAFFLYEQFEEVLVYLNTIKSFFSNDDTFNYNYAQAKAATGYYKEAEDILTQITDVSIRLESIYSVILAKCHIHSGHAEQAWDIFLSRNTSPEAFTLLQLIANECYRVGEFWIAAKAFDMLEKLDPNPEFWEGKRGACVGALQAFIMKRQTGAPPGGIGEIISLLRDSSSTQADTILRIVRKYASTLK